MAAQIVPPNREAAPGAGSAVGTRPGRGTVRGGGRGVLRSLGLSSRRKGRGWQWWWANRRGTYRIRCGDERGSDESGPPPSPLTHMGHGPFRNVSGPEGIGGRSAALTTGARYRAGSSSPRAPRAPCAQTSPCRPLPRRVHFVRASGVCGHGNSRRPSATGGRTQSPAATTSDRPTRDDGVSKVPAREPSPESRCDPGGTTEGLGPGPGGISRDRCQGPGPKEGFIIQRHIPSLPRGYVREESPSGRIPTCAH